MPNSFFKFKQFTINQSQTAMKVCTDSCIFGAIVAKENINNSIQQTLDIGTGTGLLTLMLAQLENFNQITAIEIDNAAFLQAQENFKDSKFYHKISIQNANILNWENHVKYDVIICNPPFYENELISDDYHKNIAMHSSLLLHEDLLKTATQHLHKLGSFWVLLPYSYQEKFISKAAQNQLFCKKKVLLKNTINKPPFRVIMEFTQDKNVELHFSELIIKNSQNNYTNQFIELLQPYYLYL